MTPAAIALGSLAAGLLFIASAIAAIVIACGFTMADLVLAWRNWRRGGKS